jgi:protease-4
MLKKIISLAGSGFLFTSGAILALFLGVVFIVVAAQVADDPVEMAFPRAKTSNGIFILPVEGEILTSERFRRLLSRALERDEIKAVVVAINSPGGAVGPSEEIYRAIKVADQKKPVLCAMSSVAASGGLYAAMGCRKVFVNKGTLTGSIGVIMSYPTVTQVMDKIGVEMNVIKSGELKDVGSPFRAPTEIDTTFMKGLVFKSYEQFVRAVVEGRKLEESVVRAVADGRVILGEEAVELKLADEIGGVEEAAQAALQAAGGSGEPELLYAKRPRGFQSMFEMQESRLYRFYRALFRTELLYRTEIM